MNYVFAMPNKETDFNEEFSARLRIAVAGICKRHNIDQKTVAARIGSSKSGIGNWLNGSSGMKPHKIAALKLEFGVPLDWLLAADQANLPKWISDEMKPKLVDAVPKKKGKRRAA